MYRRSRCTNHDHDSSYVTVNTLSFFNIFIILSDYIVQGDRFDIQAVTRGVQYPACLLSRSLLHVAGCFRSHILCLFCPWYLAKIDIVHTLRSFWNRRVQFNQLIASKSSINMARYFRLYSICSVRYPLASTPSALETKMLVWHLGSPGKTFILFFLTSTCSSSPPIIWRNDSSFLVSGKSTPVLAYLYIWVRPNQQLNSLHCGVEKPIYIISPTTYLSLLVNSSSVADQSSNYVKSRQSTSNLAGSSIGSSKNRCPHFKHGNQTQKSRCWVVICQFTCSRQIFRQKI